MKTEVGVPSSATVKKEFSVPSSSAAECSIDLTNEHYNDGKCVCKFYLFVLTMYIVAKFAGKI